MQAIFRNDIPEKEKARWKSPRISQRALSFCRLALAMFG
jgi:hypothetical protein